MIDLPRFECQRCERMAEDLAIANKIIEIHCQTIQELTAKLESLRAEVKRLKEVSGVAR